ncbi:hypothetical protein C7T35_28875 [Variovorax sp. WS11]|uniref:substrate-binding domain-containing protein n=1 Tax=Variovorax sp. WS11 TaxID=1105204 RepID=UPI000D0E0F64|nr:substrate-binding domain-containing protein [Variovorax sp. WS11]NDZ17258.1 hypothetical protein [Variovorax sp. WS11]PSL81105.1 hypothetical protein C7T35_28875 [Variovorax sp. WS11]
MARLLPSGNSAFCLTPNVSRFVWTIHREGAHVGQKQLVHATAPPGSGDPAAAGVDGLGLDRNPVMLRWAASYHARTQVKVNYQAIGSGGGIQQVKAGQVTFGASDKPLPPEELKAADLMQFPLVIGAFHSRSARLVTVLLVWPFVGEPDYYGRC